MVYVCISVWLFRLLRLCMCTCVATRVVACLTLLLLYELMKY